MYKLYDHELRGNHERAESCTLWPLCLDSPRTTQHPEVKVTAGGPVSYPGVDGAHAELRGTLTGYVWTELLSVDRDQLV